MHVIELGTKVRDSISGWVGIATARYEYLYGCDRYEVSGRDKDGEPSSRMFDWQQLEVWVLATGLADKRARSTPPIPGGPRDSRPVPR